MSEGITKRLIVATLAERPELRGQAFSAEFAAAVPEFMRHDPTALLYYDRGHLDHYLDFVLVAVDRDEPNRAVARAVGVPFIFGDAGLGRGELPDGGWDEVIRWAHEDRIAGRRPGAVSALEIMVLAPYRGRGMSQFMLRAMAENARQRGFADLFGPVRPTEKHREPLTPFGEYVARQRPDGLPFDSWLRVHIRMGGRIVKVAPCSMVVPGTLAEWSRWTGIRFAESGDLVVPGALAPVHVSREQDHAVYIEPNVWVHHRLAKPGDVKPGHVK